MTESTISLRPLVNGTFMPRFVGYSVTIVGTVISVNPQGTSFDLKTSDMQIVIISMRKPLSEPILGLVEVHGIVNAKNTIVCDYYMVFPDSFAQSYDQELSNKVVTLMHSLPNAWVQ